MELFIIIILLLLFFGGMPSWGYHNYGWTPSGIIGLILIIWLITFLFNRNRTSL